MCVWEPRCIPTAMKKYTASRYNIVIERNGLCYVWNTLSGAVASVDADVLNWLHCGGNAYLQSSVLEELAQNRIAIPSEFDEYKYVLSRADRILKEKNPTELSYVIAPTLRCNYRCEYCFEAGRTSFSDMNLSVAEGAWKFVEKHIEENDNLRRLHVTWFGGEPLLRLDIIEWLSAKLLARCELKNIDYRASLITNGRYLDAKAIELLPKIGVKRIQISFDGTEEAYCRVKRASNEDYLATISNVEAAAQGGLPVVLRINIRNNDFTSAYQLADLLFDKMLLTGKIKVYPAFACEGNENKQRAMRAGFVEGEKLFARYVYDKFSERSYYNKLSFAHGIACSLSCLNNFCIGPEGELYKCEHHFGRKVFRVGDIFSAGNHCFSEVYGHAISAFKHKEKCMNCPIFPICLGGCPNSNLSGGRSVDCKSYIEHMTECQIRRFTQTEMS